MQLKINHQIALHIFLGDSQMWKPSHIIVYRLKIKLLMTFWSLTNLLHSYAVMFPKVSHLNRAQHPLMSVSGMNWTPASRRDYLYRRQCLNCLAGTLGYISAGVLPHCLLFHFFRMLNYPDLKQFFSEKKISSHLFRNQREINLGTHQEVVRTL